MHHDEVETEQEDGVHLEKCSDAMILSVAAAAGGDRLNMKLSHHCSLSAELARSNSVHQWHGTAIYRYATAPTPLSTIRCRPAKTGNVDLR